MAERSSLAASLAASLVVAGPVSLEQVSQSPAEWLASAVTDVSCIGVNLLVSFCLMLARAPDQVSPGLSLSLSTSLSLASFSPAQMYLLVPADSARPRAWRVCLASQLVPARSLTSKLAPANRWAKVGRTHARLGPLCPPPRACSPRSTWRHCGRLSFIHRFISPLGSSLVYRYLPLMMMAVAFVCLAVVRAH